MAKVLVVEDDSGIALGLEDALRLEGHQVELATSGAVASRRAIDATFDLILLDVIRALMSARGNALLQLSKPVDDDLDLL